jgi:hypothetical protein
MLAGLCHSLFSVLCFSFTDPGMRELREREKEKRKKNRLISQGHLTLLLAVPSRQTDR